MGWRLFAVLTLALVMAWPVAAQDEDPPEEEDGPPVQFIIVEPPTPIVIVITATPPPAAIPAETPIPPPSSEQETLARMLGVQVVSWRVVSEDSSARRFSPELQMTVEFTNTSTESIRAYTGVMQIHDLFGRMLKNADLTVDERPLTPGQSARGMYSLRLSSVSASDGVIRGAAPDALNFVFEVRSIVLADGRRLGSGAGLR